MYELTSKITQRKAAAAQKMRQVMTAAARNSSSSPSRSNNAVQPGFLDKKKQQQQQQQPSWFARNLGADSLVGRIFPVAKNYLLFVGTVLLFHFKGQHFALLPPV